MSSSDREALTTGEIAKHCGVSFTTVIRWIQKGRLRGYQLPGRGDRRVLVGDFLSFLRENSMPIPLVYQSLKPRVLVVDDDEPLALVMARVLEKAGFDTTVALDGFSAGRSMEELLPDVMTLDIRMPRLDGLGVLKDIREREKYQSIRVLVVSGLPEGDLDRARKAGADDVLEKPFANSALVKRVRRLAGVRVQAQSV